MSSEIMAVLSMIGTLLLVVAVFVGAYFASRLVGSRYQNLGPSAKNGMELLDRRVIGKDENLLVVRAGDRVFLIGSTPYNITKIEELDPALFPKAETAIVKKDTRFYDTWKEILRKSEKRLEEDNEDGSK